ncbi:MAG: hypothetical protein K0U74_10905 [Alphaproteobacteria bacterium]|nr:hypothetical protein [Alphaproteobacteria bacterium]
MAAFTCVSGGGNVAAQGAQGAGKPASQPRFASLKASKVNLRKGPGTDYPTAWVFRRAGLPVEIIRDYEAWREVRDAEGTTGWILRTLLSGRRTAQVAPWEVKDGKARVQEPLRERARQGSEAVALVEAGVIADIMTCDGKWCQVAVGDYKGYVSQTRLWGVYPGEVLE